MRTGRAQQIASQLDDRLANGRSLHLNQIADNWKARWCLRINRIIASRRWNDTRLIINWSGDRNARIEQQ